MATQTKYAIKVMGNNQLFLYELMILKKAFKIQIYQFESIFNCLPIEMTSLMQFDLDVTQSQNFKINRRPLYEYKHIQPCDICEEVQSDKQIRKLDRQRYETRREMELSTEMKTASFFYDFHLLNIYQQVVNDDVKLNLSYLLSHLLTNYYQPPNHTQNFIKEIKLRIELGPSIDSAGKFFQFFYNHISDYEFNKTSSAPTKQQKNNSALRVNTKQ